MKKLFLLPFFILLTAFIPSKIKAQNSVRLGDVAVFRAELKSKMKKSRGGEISFLELNDTDGKVHKIRIVNSNEEKRVERFWGQENENSHFVIDFSSTGQVEGQLVDIALKKAFVLNDINGEVILIEKAIDEILCVELEVAREEIVVENTIKSKPIDPTKAWNELESLPGSTYVVYIDFDGEVVKNSRWNSGATINATASAYTDAQKREIWQLVAEDFLPFDVNVTTKRSLYDASTSKKRTMAICTPTKSWYPNAGGGVAYINSFNDTGDDPCWVWNSAVRACAETVSHEVGHTLGLRHDGFKATSSKPAGAYYFGQGEWAPIMGASWGKAVAHWSIADYANSDNTQDDLVQITTKNFPYKLDDHGNTTAAATNLIIETTGSVVADKNDGIIEKRTDLDVFKFTTSGGNVTINVANAAKHPNLVIKMRLLNSSGAQVASNGPIEKTYRASISQNLAAGTYYIEVDGVGIGDPKVTGFSDYASIGYFAISGNISVSGTKDCNQVPGGTAYLDKCNVCVAGNTGKTPCQAPLAASELKATELTCVSVKLNWKDNSTNETKFEIYRRVQGIAAETKVATLNPSIISYVDNTVKENVKYEYRILATNGAGNTTTTWFLVTVPACKRDCNNVIDGSATFDACGICSGGNTGVKPVVDSKLCNPTSIEHKLNSISVFPNPFIGNIELPINTSWKLFDVHGVLLQEGNGSQIDGTNLQSGVYFLQIPNFHPLKLIKE